MFPKTRLLLLVYVGICASDFTVKGFIEGHGWSVEYGTMGLWNMDEQGYRKGIGDVIAVILFHCLGLDERLLEVINSGL